MILEYIYKITHKGVSEEDIPYWYKRSILQQFFHTIRKFICQVWAPNSTITGVRIGLYRLCGFKIGKGSFIGMKCYLDDLCVNQIEIGNNVTISYGVYFTCHGPMQGHNTIVIKDGAYVGMRSCIVARESIEIGENSIIGAMTLVNSSVPDNAVYVGVPGKVKRYVLPN